MAYHEELLMYSTEKILHNKELINYNGVVMNYNEVAWIVARLVPGVKYEGCWYDNSIVWKDPRPFPTFEELTNRYKIYKEEEDRIAHNKIMRRDYNEATALGYTHTDGNTYRCDRDGVIDMALAVVLINLKTYTPVKCRTLDGKIVSLSKKDFKALAVLCGQHHYTLRKNYWGTLHTINYHGET